ncbi:Schwann cell myelin protein-like isoform X2 [Rhinatrema bivittatum]|uniref:Schwann cell myelin protein-like isoform X2 n=1 Tax=Rhinatrema bivittatum TaxID=194408 RepID=UPI00112718FB|nr:Schwann cell myelin protein-like isoform X2 [Rhinatrema bivittatum]
MKRRFPVGCGMELPRCAFCLIALQASFPASFQQTWSSWQPESIQALKGSCVVIPCMFTYPGPRRTSREFSVNWYLYRFNRYPEAYNSKIPVQGAFQGRTALSGDLGNSTCSLKINNVADGDADVYYTWIDPDKNSFRFYDTTTRVTVTETPEDLSLSYPEIMSEGESVTLNCSAQHTCPANPPSLTWDWTGIKASIHHEDFSGGSWRTVTSMTYSPSSEDHERSLQCSVTYPNGQQLQRKITLHIKYSPKDTVASLVGSGELAEGDAVSMTCFSRANPEETTYSWYQGLQKILIPDQTQKTIRVRNLKRDSGPYYCKVQNELGTGESPPLVLNVQYKPVILPELKCTLWGGTMTCHCIAEGHPPPAVEWHFPSWNDTERGRLNTSSSSSGSVVTSIVSGRAEEPLNISCAAFNSQGVTRKHVTHFTKEDSTLLGSSNQWQIFSGVLGGALLVLLLLGIVFYRIYQKRRQLKPEINDSPAKEKRRTLNTEDMKNTRVYYSQCKKKDLPKVYMNSSKQSAYSDEMEDVTSDYENFTVTQTVSEELYCNL